MKTSYAAGSYVDGESPQWTPYPITAHVRENCLQPLLTVLKLNVQMRNVAWLNSRVRKGT